MRKKAEQDTATLKRAAVLAHYEEVAKKLGLNPQPLLRQVGLTSQMIAVPTNMIPMDSTIALMDLTSRASGCDTVGLMMAEARTLADFGPISLLLVQQPSVRGALNTISQYRHMLNESLGLYIEDAGKTSLILKRREKFALISWDKWTPQKIWRCKINYCLRKHLRSVPNKRPPEGGHHHSA